MSGPSETRADITGDATYRVLVIDDEPSIRTVLGLHLSGAGYDVALCATGAEGMERAIGGGFDLILCDLKLADMSGLDVIRNIRRNGNNTPVIAVSGFIGEDMIEQVGRISNTGYLSKPFLKQELLEKVQKTIGRHED